MARVLIIEDNPTNLKLATFLLQSVGHTVLSATDAEAGLARARAERPDLILMAFDAVQVLRHDHKSIRRRVPILTSSERELRF